MCRLSLKDDKALPFFAGFCFFLSLIDILVPKPLPFFRLGLANLAIMLSMDILSHRSFFALLLVKVLGQAMLSGTMFSYIVLFSFLGTISSAFVMYVLNFLRKKRLISFIGISMLGAFASNISQFFLARFVILGEGAYFILPPFLLISLISSVILGLVANSFYVASLWYESLLTGEIALRGYDEEKPKEKHEKKPQRLIIGLIMIILFIMIDVPTVKVIIFGVALILCIVDRIKINVLNLVLTYACIIIFNFFPPCGYVIFKYNFFGMFNIIITKEALFNGIMKATLFEGLLYISRWMLKTHIELRCGLGSVINKSIFVFQRLITCKKEIRFSNLIGTLDSVLLSLDRIL